MYSSFLQQGTSWLLYSNEVVIDLNNNLQKNLSSLFLLHGTSWLLVNK